MFGVFYLLVDTFENFDVSTKCPKEQVVKIEKNKKDKSK